jgi:hypothetical protein
MSMDPPLLLAQPPGAKESNRLHAEVEKLSVQSRDALHSALVAAWNAGQLLVVEKRNVRRSMGPGAWCL